MVTPFINPGFCKKHRGTWAPILLLEWEFDTYKEHEEAIFIVPKANSTKLMKKIPPLKKKKIVDNKINFVILLVGVVFELEWMMIKALQFFHHCRFISEQNFFFLGIYSVYETIFSSLKMFCDYESDHVFLGIIPIPCARTKS